MPETDRTFSTAARPAHVVQSGVWFYVVGRDGGYVRAADGDEDDLLVSYSLRDDAQAHADQLNASMPTATARLLDTLRGYQVAGAEVIHTAALAPDSDEDTIADLIAAALAEREGAAAAWGG